MDQLTSDRSNRARTLNVITLHANFGKFNDVFIDKSCIKD